MTEKRFTQKDEDDWEILDRNKHFAYAHSGYQAEKIIQELNELVETNRELYKDNKQLKQYIQSLKKITKEVEDFFQKCGFDTVNFRVLEELIDADNFIYEKYLKLKEENEQLKEEKELLKNKLDRIEDILPHYLSCAEISEFHSKTFKEDIALMKCWNKRYQK